MFWDDLMQFSAFKNFSLTLANTSVTVTNKAFLIKAILDAVLCSFWWYIWSLIDITATHFGRILISNKFTIFKNIKIAKFLLIVKIFLCLTSLTMLLAQVIKFYETAKFMILYKNIDFSTIENDLRTSLFSEIGHVFGKAIFFSITKF